MVKLAHVAIFTLTVILTGVYSIDSVYAADQYATPYQQIRDGVSVYGVQCNEPTNLYIRNADTAAPLPICITPSTYQALLDYGMTLSVPTLNDLLLAIDDAGNSEVQQVVTATIRMYESDPENAFANINAVSELSVLHYPFVLDPDTRTILANGANPEIIGMQSAVIGEFATNPPDEIIAQLETGEGVWADYVFINPETNRDQLKRSWLLMHDGYIFGSGYYYSIDEKLATGLQNTIDLLDMKGDAAFEIITTARDRGQYASVFDPAANLEVANSRQPHRVGGPLPPLPIPWMDFAEILRGVDEPIRAYVLIINPATGKPAQVAGLLDDYGKYILANGYTYPAEDKVKRVVNDAIALYEEDENAFELLTQTSLDPHYPFVVDASTEMIVAHGANPDRVGVHSLFFDGTIDTPSDQILEGLQNDEGIWVDYLFPLPGSDYEEEKRSWLVMHDGYIFGAGYYQSAFISHPDAQAVRSPSISDKPLVYSQDTVIDDPYSLLGYTPTRVWADFGVVEDPEIAFETRDHQFDMVNGNALHGVFIPHLAPFLQQEISPRFNDPPTVFRVVTLLLNGAFDAVAPYHETAVGVHSRIDRLPASESETNESPNTSVMYAEYRMLLEFAPHRQDDWRSMMTLHGFDPDDASGLDLDCSVQQSISSPAAIGNFAGKCVLDAHRNDGFNQLGLETDGVWFGDTTGYVSANTHEELVDPTRWQPLVLPNVQGEIAPQKFLTPQYANVEPYSDFNPRDIRVPPPTSSNYENMDAYKAQADAVIETAANITDEQKMLVEFFDNKLRGSLFRPALSNYHDVVDFVQWDFLINMANYDAGIVIWQEKVRYDAVRPASAIPYLYGDELITARGPPGGELTQIPANEWAPYVNTAGHAEYPSATASFCVVDAAVWRLFSGTDEIGQYVDMEGNMVGAYQGVRPAGSSVWEAGTPVEDLHLQFDTWTEYADECGASRVWAGVHFWPSVQVVEELGDTVGVAAFKYWESLMLGEAPLRGPLTPLAPDPLLEEPFWTETN